MSWVCHCKVKNSHINVGNTLHSLRDTCSGLSLGSPTRACPPAGGLGESDSLLAAPATATQAPCLRQVSFLCSFPRTGPSRSYPQIGTDDSKARPSASQRKGLSFWEMGVGEEEGASTLRRGHGVTRPRGADIGVGHTGPLSPSLSQVCPETTITTQWWRKDPFSRCPSGGGPHKCTS